MNLDPPSQKSNKLLFSMNHHLHHKAMDNHKHLSSISNNMVLLLQDLQEMEDITRVAFHQHLLLIMIKQIKIINHQVKEDIPLLLPPPLEEGVILLPKGKVHSLRLI